MPAAATLGHFHVCPKVNPGPVPHVGGPVAKGSPNVLICGMPAARVGDMAVCVGPPDKIVKDSSTVIINGKPAARMGDATAHGGIIISGAPTVLIGDTPGAPTPAPISAPPPTSSSSDTSVAVAAASAIAGVSAAQAAQESRQQPAKTQNTNDIELVKKAVSRTHSKQYDKAVSEAAGELGMEEYKQQAGIKDDPRFIKRFHGPDDLAKDINDKMVGLEAKGRADGRVTLNEHRSGVKQLSREANFARARKMLNKRKKGKIGKHSNRIGGPYTQQEMDLYNEIEVDGGRKKLVSTHTNSTTGEVTVVKSDSKGESMSKEKFQIENYAEKKKLIMKLLRHLL